MDTSVSYTEEELRPLFQTFGKLHCLVDDHVHLQQAAITTIVVYNSYYEQKLAHIQGLMDFSASWGDKEFGVDNQKDTKKAILKAKAHKKSLSSVSGLGPSGGGSRPANGKSMSGKSTRSKHNNMQCELYQKRKKAKKVE